MGRVIDFEAAAAARRPVLIRCAGRWWRVTRPGLARLVRAWRRRARRRAAGR